MKLLSSASFFLLRYTNLGVPYFCLPENDVSKCKTYTKINFRLVLVGSYTRHSETFILNTNSHSNSNIIYLTLFFLVTCSYCFLCFVVYNPMNLVVFFEQNSFYAIKDKVFSITEYTKENSENG